MKYSSQELVFFTGNANKPLAEAVSQRLDVPISKSLVGKFSDGETRVELLENVRGADVFIFQSLCSPANEHIMEAAIMADACRRASADRVTLVAPYFAYARQERKSAPRTPITAKLVADLIEASGFNRLLTLELHTSAIQGFFNIPVDHLFSKPVFVEYFNDLDNLCIISPDAGGVERARAFAKHFDCSLAIIDKRRDSPNESAVMHVIGDVQDKNCIIVDDMCDTAGSLVNAANSLKERGAKSIRSAITHAIFSGPAIERIAASPIDELVVTDTIPLSTEAKKVSKIKQLTVSELVCKAIRRIHNSESVSSLFI